MPNPERKLSNFNMKIEHRRQLEAISAHHRSAGRDYMSMTRVVEGLVKEEFERLKLRLPK